MTAEEFRNKEIEKYGDKLLIKEIEIMISFAKYHVKKALERAALNSQVEVVDYEPLSEIAKKSELLPIYGVDENSILNAYPLESIK